MRASMIVCVAALAIAVAQPAPAEAQGPDRPPAEKEKERARKARGQGQGQERARPPGQREGKGQGQAKGQDLRPGGPAAAADARSGRAHGRARRGGPAPDREAFNRDLVRRAVAVRGRRHDGASRVRVRGEGGEVRVVRDDGEVLFALDRDAAERLGYWRVGVASPWTPEPRRDRDRDGGIFDRLGDDDARSGSPAFCRSGEGHPVWGREWCLDKGFGLGDRDGVWGRATDIEDIIFRRPRTDRDALDRGGLADVLGDIVFGRIALQSLVLGADEPLTGRWIGEARGPRVLRIVAGDLAVAELVDADRDERVDVALFNLGG